MLGELPLVRWMPPTVSRARRHAVRSAGLPAAQDDHRDVRRQPAVLPAGPRNYRDPILCSPRRRGRAGPGIRAGPRRCPRRTCPIRAWFGFGVGASAYAGIDVLRDFFGCRRGAAGGCSLPRYYLVHALLGGFIGAAIGFYLDAAQVSVVVAKFHRYLAAGRPPELFDIYPLVSKWGHLNLGTVTGGVGLLFAEALAGVISWSTAAWLFAINRTFMRAYFWKDATPIRTLFTRDGLIQLGENMIQVLRWGLWMSPIINSFLRPMGEPTWYNQDGAIRTVIAIFRDATMTPEAFRAWSLQVFIYLLAYDAVRILIWLDHMGLRVATLVNLSFLGMDRLEQRLARFLAPAATARCIPEGVKRFTTWGPAPDPLLHPPRQGLGSRLEHGRGDPEPRAGRLLATLVALPSPREAPAPGRGRSSRARPSSRPSAGCRSRRGSPSPSSAVAEAPGLRGDAEGGRGGRQPVPGRDYDVSRRSYDLLDPAGRALFLVDTPADAAGRPPRAWPVVGNFPGELADASRFERRWAWLEGQQHHHRAPDDRRDLPAGAGDPAELWTITVENLTDSARTIKVVPYLEWVLNRPEADRGHTQYNRLFAEMEYVGGLHAVLAWDKHAKAMGLLASDRAPEGFLTSRIDFIGRARSLWTPRVLETLAFSKARDTPAHPTLDPIGSLLIGLTLPGAGIVSGSPPDRAWPGQGARRST